VTVWNPAQYLKFSGERLQPALDLMGRITLENPARIVDLGCGPGNVTAILAGHFQDASVQGIDNSAEMLAKASDIPGISWQQGDIATWQAENPVSLIYSNAALHWIADHGSLFPRLLRQLEPGGQLAVQMPSNHLAVTHTAITEAVAAGPWQEKLSPLVQETNVHELSYYYDLLSPLCNDLSLWQTEYVHVLDGENPIVEWTSGSALKRFLDVLSDPEERRAFLADYGQRVGEAYPKRSDGKTLLPFRRLFIIAST